MSGFPGTPEEERQLREALDRLARMRIPEERDLWPALQARLFTPSPHGGRWVIGGKWAWMAAGLLLALVFLGMAFAPNLWEAFFLTQPLERDRKLQPLSLTQTREGVTVIVERAYADANRILIGYRVRGLPESPGAHWIPVLTLEDASGRPIPSLIGEGLVGASEILGLSLPPGELAGVVGFDPWGLPDWPARRPEFLSLRLHVAFQAVPYPAPTPGIRWMQIHPESGPVREGSVPVTPHPVESPTPAAGWRFTFDFTVPVEPEAERYGPRSEVAHGLELTLEQWVWAPSGARARVCFIPPDPQLSWTMHAELMLEAKDEVSPLAPSGEITGEEALTITAPILESPPQQHGEQICLDRFFAASQLARGRPAVFQVLELVGWSPGAAQPARRWRGPWVFRIP
ncbi:MAG TPA: DUF4179 domain-containing protein [Thermoflexus sp.]|nr:DUF4179 domain-containing protein [Thermoflexus sp.]